MIRDIAERAGLLVLLLKRVRRVRAHSTIVNTVRALVAVLVEVVRVGMMDDRRASRGCNAATFQKCVGCYRAMLR